MNLDIRPQDLIIVQNILHQLPVGARVWVFGSRANGRARRGSDLDLAIDAGRPLTQNERINLSSDFENSDLPYTVDIVDLQTVDSNFKSMIESSRIELQN